MFVVDDTDLSKKENWSPVLLYAYRHALILGFFLGTSFGACITALGFVTFLVLGILI